eukprot:5465513-Lingulodinium_polyedra.AAC.1
MFRRARTVVPSPRRGVNRTLAHCTRGPKNWPAHGARACDLSTAAATKNRFDRIIATFVKRRATTRSNRRAGATTARKPHSRALHARTDF